MTQIKSKLPKNALSSDELLLFKLVVRLEDATLSEVIDALPATNPIDRQRIRSVLDKLVSLGLLGHREGSRDLYFVPDTHLKILTASLKGGLDILMKESLMKEDPSNPLLLILSDLIDSFTET